MGFHELCSHFDQEAYAKKLQGVSTAELQQREVAKTRQKVAAVAKISGGLALAHFTGGTSLLSSALGGRQGYIATKKFKLVEAELTSRGITPYELRKRDIAIPVTIYGATMAMGFELTDVAHHVTSEVSANLVSHTAGATQVVINSPETFVHGLGEGMIIQTKEVLTIFSSGGHEAMAQATIDSGFWNEVSSGLTCIDPSEAIGASSGMALAQNIEKWVLVMALGQSLEAIADLSSGKLSPPITILPPPKTCSRVREPKGPLFCDHCDVEFERSSTSYYHCCKCDDDTEICLDCVHKGCLKGDSKHMLYRMKPQDDAEVSDSCCQKHLPPWTSSPVSHTQCNYCSEIISQSQYYHCCRCNEDTFDICEGCFSNGKRCLDKSHTYLIQLREMRNREK